MFTLEMSFALKEILVLQSVKDASPKAMLGITMSQSSNNIGYFTVHVNDVCK